ncbi:hypothetical protein BDR26DRAFT_1005553 [Obelidium mucronatum]|nr:hypothetical protein BDR26DRAFT_1005553 [Obelidium mucronatum]
MQEAQDAFSSAVTEEDFTLMTKVQTEAAEVRRLIKEARDAMTAYQLQIEKAKTDIPLYTSQIAAVAKEVMDLRPRSIAFDKETWDKAHTAMTTRQTRFQKVSTSLQSPAQGGGTQTLSLFLKKAREKFAGIGVTGSNNLLYLVVSYFTPRHVEHFYNQLPNYKHWEHILTRPLECRNLTKSIVMCSHKSVTLILEE